MEVSASSMNGAMAGAPVTFNVPRQTSGASRSEQTSGGFSAPVSKEQVKQMVEQMQGQLDSMHVSLQYRVYGENSEKIAVRVVNRETGDVIREFPPKEMQALQAKMSELVGMIFNDNA